MVILGKDAIQKFTIRWTRDALAILLLFNSRSKILKTQDPVEDYATINRKRRKNGKEAMLPMHPVVFDVARIVGKGEVTEIDAMQEMAAALVRGHFKVRQTGVFFWSPYVRNARDEDHSKKVYEHEIGMERRDVISTGPSELPQPRPSA